MNWLKCFLFIFVSTLVTAQKNVLLSNYTFSCTSGFYQLINNQLNLLSVDAKGKIEWQPVLPKFERPLSAISYCLEDDFMYSFDTLNHELLRIYQSGTIQSLGIPKHETSNALLNTQLTIGEIGQGLFCAYSPNESLLYWVNIEKNTFVTTTVWLDERVLNMVYIPRRNVFCTVGRNSTFYFWDPVSKKEIKGGLITDLPHTEGHLWITKEERFFATRRAGKVFYELDAHKGMAYRYSSPLLPTTGDATSCVNASAPSFIGEEVLELKLDSPKRDRIMLRWIGINEYTAARYIVEHRLDGNLWKEVNRKPSNGINNYQNPYGALCPYKEGVANYYRLKKIAHYGNRTTYSQTVVWRDKKEKQFIVSPIITLGNRALSLFFSGYQDEYLTIRLLNSYGQIVYEKKEQLISPELTLSLPIANFLTGNYTLTVISNAATEQIRIWLQK